MFAESHYIMAVCVYPYYKLNDFPPGIMLDLVYKGV